MSIERRCYRINKNILGAYPLCFLTFIRCTDSSFVSVNFLDFLAFSRSKILLFTCQAFRQREKTWLAPYLSYHGLSEGKPVFKLTFSLTPWKYIPDLNRIYLLLEAITIGKGQMGFLGSVGKLIKRAQSLLQASG